MMFLFQSDTEAYYGHQKNARDLVRKAMESDRLNDMKETAALVQVSGALREAEFSNFQKALRDSAEALAAAGTRDVKILAALAQARAGDSNRAQKLADELQERFPLDTLINHYWLPSIRATMELNRKNPAKALELLEPSLSYELGSPSTWFEGGAPMYPAYARGRAFLLLGQGVQAAFEFQKFRDHRGITENSYLGALAYLGLARAYALEASAAQGAESKGDLAKARAAYQDFFALWKDADPDIPILKQAKAEYAKLK